MCGQSEMVDLCFGADSEEIQSYTHLLKYHEIHLVSILGEKN